MTEANPQEINKIETDDEIRIVIGTVEQIEDTEEQNAIEYVEQQAERSNNVNLEKETGCREKSGKDFVVYNVNEPPKRYFPRQQSVLVYFQDRPVPTEGAPLQYDGSRNDFVRLVFTLLFIMLCTTIVCTMSAQMFTPIQKFLSSLAGVILLLVMVLMIFVLHYVMYCSTCSRSPPMNFICLLIVTVGYSYLVAYITLRYRTVIILGAFIGTASISLICILLAMTSFDFTKFLVYVVVISMAVAAVFLAYLLGKSFFGWEMKPLHIGLLIIATVLNAIMLVIELQMILGGKYVELGEDDYALGAYMLYVSIIEMFLRLLQLLELLTGD